MRRSFNSHHKSNSASANLGVALTKVKSAQTQSGETKNRTEAADSSTLNTNKLGVTTTTTTYAPLEPN